MESTNEDRITVQRLNGLFVGLLTDNEVGSFERCIADGLAERSYEGAGGFMGLSKVRFYYT